MVGKKSGKALLRDEGGLQTDVQPCPCANFTRLGLERTDNNMELSSWPQIAPINQKNYYTYVVEMPSFTIAPLSKDRADL